MKKKLFLLLTFILFILCACQKNSVESTLENNNISSQTSFSSSNIESVVTEPTLGETVSCECSHLKTKIINNMFAGCVSVGYTGDEVCIYCGKTISVGTSIKAHGHTVVIKNKKIATCTKNGYTGDEVCSVCNEVVKYGKIIKAIGHNTKTVDIISPTCTEVGFDGNVVCDICAEVIKYGDVVNATGHNIVVVNKEQETCFAFGYTGDEVCSICGYMIKQGSVIEKLEHTIEVKNFVETTCTQDGYSGDEICINCDAIIKLGEIIKSSGHQIKIVGFIPVTCVNDGYSGDAVCTICSKTITFGHKTSATGHQNVELVDYIAPTKTTEGYSGDEICIDCDAIIKLGDVIPVVAVEMITYTTSDGTQIQCPSDVDPYEYTIEKANKSDTHSHLYIEEEILRLVNIEREKVNLPPLIMDERAYYFSKIRANECFIKFEHTRPSGKKWSSVYYEEGVIARVMGENLAICTGASLDKIAKIFVNGWMNSESHRANILNEDFKYITISIVVRGNTCVGVQNFLG